MAILSCFFLFSTIVPFSSLVAVVGLINVAATVLLLFLASSTKSMSLSAFSYVTVFDSFALLTCFLSLWVERQAQSPAYSFGHKRTQVLAVFSATILAQLGALFSIKGRRDVGFRDRDPDLHIVVFFPIRW